MPFRTGQDLPGRASNDLCAGCKALVSMVPGSSLLDGSLGSCLLLRQALSLGCVALEVPLLLRQLFVQVLGPHLCLLGVCCCSSLHTSRSGGNKHVLL